MAKEKDLIKKIKDYLKTVDDCFYWKEHGGMYGVAGLPDIIICYRGHFIGVEAKVKPNGPTKLQEATIKRIIKCGGLAKCVYSVDEVKDLLNVIDERGVV